MHVKLRHRNVALPPEARDEISDRIRFGLGRLTAEVRRVELSVEDVNGPRGGIDKLVRLRVFGRSVGSLVVARLGADVMATVATAIDRCERAILRALERRRSFVTAPARS